MAVVNAAPNANRAAIGIDQWVNCLNFCVELATRQRVHVEQRSLAALDLGLKTLWQPEVNKNSVDVLDVDDIGTVF